MSTVIFMNPPPSRASLLHPGLRRKPAVRMHLNCLGTLRANAGSALTESTEKAERSPSALWTNSNEICPLCQSFFSWYFNLLHAGDPKPPSRSHVPALPESPLKRRRGHRQATLILYQNAERYLKEYLGKDKKPPVRLEQTRATTQCKRRDMELWLRRRNSIIQILSKKRGDYYGN